MMAKDWIDECYATLPCILKLVHRLGIIEGNHLSAETPGIKITIWKCRYPICTVSLLKPIKVNINILIEI